jgi:hypothetical protein
MKKFILVALFLTQNVFALDADFVAIRSQVINENGSVKMEYAGLSGQVEYADTFYEGDLGLAIRTTLAQLNETESFYLNWSTEFTGDSEDFVTIRELLVKKNGNINYDMWFGESTGLTDLAIELNHAYKGPAEPNKKTVEYYRELIRGSVSFLEQTQLGWIREQSLELKAPRLHDLANIPAIKRYVHKQTGNLIKQYTSVDVMEAIKKAMKR